MKNDNASLKFFGEAHDLVSELTVLCSGSLFGFASSRFGFLCVFGLTVWFLGSQKCFVIAEHCGSLFGFLAHCLVFGLTILCLGSLLGFAKTIL